MRLGLQAWMTDPRTTAVMDALGEARFVGGAVRNALLGETVGDIDIATPLLPEQVITRLSAAGLKAVPTGLDHGTVTAISNGKPYEITTLRRDVTTDGRKATVAFTTDWKEDAARRDFTLNALYADRNGEVFDYFDGKTDLDSGRIRFVGDAKARIAEDFLRILRLFRFQAWYGKTELDPSALDAARTGKTGLAKLSGERIAKEMLRLLEAENPITALKDMQHCGVLSEILPAANTLTRLENLIALDAANFFPPDPLLRLAALLPDTNAARFTAARWKLSNAQRSRLEAALESEVSATTTVQQLRQQLYRHGTEPVTDRLRLAWAADADTSNTVTWLALHALAQNWQRPIFPLTGGDVMQAGIPEGPLVGDMLAQVEGWWMEQDFTPEKPALLQKLGSLRKI